MRVGPSAGDQVAVVAGLQAGERLIVVGQRLVADGQTINVVD